MNILFAFEAIQKLFTHLMNRCFAVFCYVFGDFEGYLGGLVKFREIRNNEDLNMIVKLEFEVKS